MKFVYTFLEAAAFVPPAVKAVIIVLSAVILAALAFDAFMMLKISKARKLAEASLSETAAEAKKSSESGSAIKAEAAPAVRSVEFADRDEDSDGSFAQSIISLGGREIEVRYNRSFTAKLIQAPEETKEFYSAVKNYLLSFKGIKARISWRAESFTVGRRQLAKLTVRGKTLNVNLALNPADYPDTYIKVGDMSDTKSYAAVPFAFKVKSNRGVYYAKKFIDEIVKASGLVSTESNSIAAVCDYPYEETAALIGRGLIKVKAVNGEEITDFENIVSKPFKLHERVSATEAHNEISDEAAMAMLVEKGALKSAAGRKYAVNIDTLADNFNAGDTVGIEALKKKGLVPKKESAVKILARGTLDKSLTVEANAFSADAVKMIILCGGKAVRLG